MQFMQIQLMKGTGPKEGTATHMICPPMVDLPASDNKKKKEAHGRFSST